MKKLKIVTILAFIVTSPALIAGDDDARGPEKVGEGIVKTVTSPGKIVEGIAEETEDKGAVGLVTGPVKGGAKAGVKAVDGAADIATGVVETILSPLTGNND